MLPNTFRHIPGLGLKTERRFWDAGLLSWDDFKTPLPIKLPTAKISLINDYLRQSQSQLATNPHYFTDLLTSSQHWRIFPHYRHTTAYLDIETTGLSDRHDHITTIALYDGRTINYYIYGTNLADFVADIERYDVLVTYNGKTFDLPFIERFFDIEIKQAHIDLRYVLRSLGYAGGLKNCERQLGLERGNLEGVDGYLAVLLWREYERSGNTKALDTLLAYNIEDAVNLEMLMVKAYNLSLQNTPFYPEGEIPPPSRPVSPFHPDPKLIDRIKRAWRP